VPLQHEGYQGRLGRERLCQTVKRVELEHYIGGNFRDLPAGRVDMGEVIGEGNTGCNGEQQPLAVRVTDAPIVQPLIVVLSIVVLAVRLILLSLLRRKRSSKPLAGSHERRNACEN
jgi:hypothetical protein